MTVQGATFNMHGQLYHGHTNAMALFSSLLAGARRCAFEMCGEKKMQAPLLGLAKSIYYHNILLDQPLAQVFVL